MSAEEITMTAVERIEQQPVQNMNAVIAEAEGRALLLKRVLPELVKVCHERNVHKFGESIYIDNDGCQKIARIVGVSYGKPDIDKRYEEDPDSGARVYVVDVSGEASAFGQTIFEVGGCTSTDGFLASRRLPFLELRQETIKKALANWQGRCVRTLLGIKELSEVEMNNANFDVARLNKVDFKSGKYSSRKDTSEDKAAADETKTKIRNQILSDVQNHQEAAAELLEIVTSFKGRDGNQVKGRRSVSTLSDSAAATTWNKIKPGGKDRDAYYDALRDILDKYDINPDEPPDNQGVVV